MVTALDRAAEAAHHLNTAFGLFCDAIDRLHTTLHGSQGGTRAAVEEVLDTVAVAARVLWALQLAYLDAERLINAYIKSLDGTPPPRAVEFPGHVEPDAHFGPNPNRHYPALVKVPLVRAGEPAHRTNTWATRVRRGLPEYEAGKTDGALYVDSDRSWRLLSGVDRNGGLTGEAEKHIPQAIGNGFFEGKPVRFVVGHARMLKQAATHVETKAAVRCFQAVELILRRGQTMRVWVVGEARPIVIRGKARG
ncbi:hypothetical protein [Saccharothrix sp. HUAS TT1]|uniref:hypothetical protein n=1 Tax=unclassified Saccharothrix TaxID=2593673 RepID=UPI00345BDE37